MARTWRRCCLLTLCTTLLVGCGEEEPRVYSVAKTTEPSRTPTDPHTVAPPPPPAGNIARWTLPEGWRQAPGGAGSMRFATLTSGDGSLEVAVTRLSGQAGGLLANINRWRGQLGLEAIAQDQLRQQMKLFDTGDGPGAGILVDLSQSPPGDQRMVVALYLLPEELWFFRALASGEVIAAHEKDLLALFESVRFRVEAPASRAEPTRMTWTAPPGWTQQADAAPPRVAAFTITGDGQDRAELTVISLAGAGGEPLANINRWRSQVGLSPVATLADQPTTSIRLDGRDAVVLDLIGAEDGYDAQATSRVIVAMQRRGAVTWFIKLTGPKGLLDQQRANFDQFLTSFRFGDRDE